MKELLIESKGIRTDQYFIPPFELREGEIVVIYLYGGPNFYDVEMNLVNIFTGKIKDDNVKIFQPFTFTEHFKESRLRRLFNPVSVGEYLKKNAEPNNEFAEKIFEIDWISKKTKVNTLAGNPRRSLSLYAVLSKTKNIIFDLVAQDPEGAKKSYELVKDEIKKGGAAILIDWADDMKDNCSKFIKIEWLIDLEENRRTFNF